VAAGIALSRIPEHDLRRQSVYDIMATIRRLSFQKLN